jgi:hypothetical protein
LLSLSLPSRPTIQALICPPTFIALLVWGVVVTNGGDSPYIKGPSATTPAGGKVMAVFTGINAMASVASTIAVNIPGAATFSPLLPDLPALCTPLLGAAQINLNAPLRVRDTSLDHRLTLHLPRRLFSLPEEDELRLDSNHRHAHHRLRAHRRRCHYYRRRLHSLRNRRSLATCRSHRQLWLASG